MTPNLRARLIVISIVLVVSLSVPLLTGSPDVRATAGFQPDATSLIDRHCGALQHRNFYPANDVDWA